MTSPLRPSLAAVSLLVLSGCLGGKADADDKKPTNHLVHESSPYLQQHAHNPVAWYPWGPEAFEKAKKEGKYVFLSIGYSSCHWCHVMERESFSNEEVAKLLNDWFVCIKVDREERPDIDHVYMTALQVLGVPGGWPLTMFLTPDAKPIFGGTYWPPDDKEVDGKTVRGLKSLLKTVHGWQSEKGKDLAKQADELAEKTAAALAAGRGIGLVELDRDLVTGVTDDLTEEFDRVHGGFGSPSRKFQGTKFPTPPYLRLLQAEAERTKSKDLAGMVTLTLDRMACGGIYDQLGGGFHRYSTERTWTVPHFEKMLYDNAQLVEVYSEAYRTTKSPLYKRVVQETLAFVGRELTDRDGGFYSALDADSDGQEGRFYVWTPEELDEFLKGKTDADLFRKVYGTDRAVNFDGKYHILTLRDTPADRARELNLTEEQLDARLKPLREKLFEVRSKRNRPFLDTKILTAWNGQMIAGYAVAGRVLEEPKYTEAAARAAEFLLRTMKDKDGRLLRSYGAAPEEKPTAKLNGYLDDYAFVVHGLLCLHDATGEKKWLDEAKALTETMAKYYGDKDNGGFFYVSSDHEKLFARAKDQYDSVQPSGNSTAALNLVRLWVKTGDDGYRVQAEKTLKTFATGLKSNPTNLATMAEALDLYLDQKKK
jgi:uncharacterized protein YyaL (SSP411 family)